MSDAQKLAARDAEVLWAIRAFFEANRYKTDLNFDEVLEACPENIVAGVLRPILEHLELSRFLRQSPYGLFSLTPLGLGFTDKREALAKNTFTAFCDLLLVALADHTARQGTRFDAFDLRAVAELYALDFAPGWIERASEVFEKRGWATVSRVLSFGQDRGFDTTLIGDGLLKAEELRNELTKSGVTLPSYPPPDSSLSGGTSAVPSAGTSPIFVAGKTEISMLAIEGFVPASDRIVRLDDNAPGRLEAIENLHQIEKILESGNNELKLTADERIVIVSEIKPLRERLLKKHVRVGEVCSAVTKGSPLVWLLDKAAGHAVGIVITAALAALGLLAKALIG